MAGALVVLIGPSGAGKSTFAERHFGGSADHRVVSLDEYRYRLTGNMADQTATPGAAQIQGLMVRARLRQGLVTVVDGTNAEQRFRTELLREAFSAAVPVVAVVFHTDVEVCVARQEARRVPTPKAPWGRVTPEGKVRWQHAAVKAAAPTLHLSRFAVVAHLEPPGARSFRLGFVDRSLGGALPWLADLPFLAGWPG